MLASNRKNEYSEVKVRDHCPLTRNSGGAAHQPGNLNIKIRQPSFVLFLFHNFDKNDSHLFIR